MQIADIDEPTDRKRIQDISHAADVIHMRMSGDDRVQSGYFLPSEI